MFHRPWMHRHMIWVTIIAHQHDAGAIRVSYATGNRQHQDLGITQAVNKLWSRCNLLATTWQMWAGEQEGRGTMLELSFDHKIKKKMYKSRCFKAVCLHVCGHGPRLKPICRIRKAQFKSTSSQQQKIKWCFRGSTNSLKFLSHGNAPPDIFSTWKNFNTLQCRTTPILSLTSG